MRFVGERDWAHDGKGQGGTGKEDKAGQDNRDERSLQGCCAAACAVFNSLPSRCNGRGTSAVHSDTPLAGYLTASAFYSLSLQSHHFPSFFVKANDIILQSRSAVFYPIYPCLSIS